MAQSTKTRTKNTGKSSSGRAGSGGTVRSGSGTRKSSSAGSAGKSSSAKASSAGAKRAKNGASSRSSSGRGKGTKNTVDRRAEARKQAVRNREAREREVREDITLVVLLIIMSFLFLSLLNFGGGVGRVLGEIMFGLFGIGAWGVPFYLFAACYFMITGKGGQRMQVRMLALLLILLIVETGGHLYLHSTGKNPLDLVFSVKSTFKLCAEQRIGGGVIGGALASVLYYAFRLVGSVLLLIGAGIIALILLLQVSPSSAIHAWQRRRQEDDRPGFAQRRAMYRQRRLEEWAREREDQIERDTDRILHRQERELQRMSQRSAQADASESPKKNRRSAADISVDLEHTRLDRASGSGQKSLPGKGGKNSRSRGGRISPAPMSSRDVHEIIVLPDENEDALTIPAKARKAAGTSVYTDAGRSSPDPEGTRFIHSVQDYKPSDSLHYDRMPVSGEGSSGRGRGDAGRRDSSYPGETELIARAGGSADSQAGRGNGLYPASDLTDSGRRGAAPDVHAIHVTEPGQVSDGSKFPKPQTPGARGSGFTSFSETGFKGSGVDAASSAAGPEASVLNTASSETLSEGSGDNISASGTGPQESGANTASAGTIPQESGLNAASAGDGSRGSSANTASAGAGSRGSGADASLPGPDTGLPGASPEELADIAIHRDDGRNKTRLPGAARTARPVGAAYVHPPFSLLDQGTGGRSPETERELLETAGKLQDTLRTFGVQVTITDISQGPSVTRYELKPERGVKVSKIVNLSDDIKLRLAATDIRIEAPIPGKSAIGIEVPNKYETTVHLRELFETREFKNFKGKLPFAVGKDIGGKTIIADIARMPHLLIAGATGSGKSVCINTIILSILYSTSPDDVKLLMIDPKVVELSVYKKIPHLIIPVVTDARKASAALNWAVAEMEKRYKLFAAAGVRDLNGFNSLAASYRGEDGEPQYDPMPRLVIIVDELADLMMVAKSDVESAICRLAQLARAAGIHLIIATQRPSVDVITGLIKANMPSRIAFSVSSQVDSRTILDMAGAEKLIGRGDMLFSPQNYQKPARIQGAFVSDGEVSRVVEYITSRNKAEDHNEDVNRQIEDIQVNGVPAMGFEDMKSSDSMRDEHFVEAGKYIIEKNKASIGLLQRVFKIGFNRAARIMDQLAEAGVVSEESSTRARQVLMTLPEFEAFLENENG